MTLDFCSRCQVESKHIHDKADTRLDLNASMMRQMSPDLGGLRKMAENRLRRRRAKMMRLPSGSNENGQLYLSRLIIPG